ncbi:MAG: CtsR family transcriptional regulator [Dethiobacter sp.]|jgi:transcriptional regulator CtsR|nr:MAG: CtsR family transcriptional regulator [Dethiobacter sp.]
MSTLADGMEDYLKKLLTLSVSGYIDIKRKELSGKFNCVPSQVNYVLETRFTLEKGYLVESKRGGKGFVRIRKLQASLENLLDVFLQDILSGQISDDRARGLIQRLYDLKYISLRESRLMEATLDSLTIIKDKSLQETLRGWLLKDMLLMLIKFA